ncbi:DcrB-related protein [Enterobacter roggenkampii]|uniref:DcrB-related protein n=1 Tax=Enterobacter roggenkampii TaxID=1812935 RepID=UPI003BC7040A
MAEYILQEASLALPDVFKDRTMNLFTLSDNGASEFTFVVSRASAKNEDKVHDAATRLVRELEITVPDFRLESSQMTSVDGLPAVELFYQFKNDNAIIFQRQTVILLGDHPGGQKMVCYIGTCPGEFSDYYHNQYQEIIRSIKFHKPAQTETREMLAADSQGPFFALDSESKELSVFETFRNCMDIFRFSGRKRGNICFLKNRVNHSVLHPFRGANPFVTRCGRLSQTNHITYFHSFPYAARCLVLTRLIQPTGSVSI